MSAVGYLAQAHEANCARAHREPLSEAVVLALNQAAALVLLIVLAPLMAMVAFLIWRRDGAPFLFAHFRVGHDGKLFRCLKFRSMLRDSERVLADLLRDDAQARAEWARDHKLADDPRVTAIGRLLRRTSLDELPQLFNVLRGEMCLVGPRPITVAELKRYGKVRWHYLMVRPGITGLWQVSGRSNTTYEQRVELDRHYVEQRSLLGDARILCRTVRVVLLREGAH
jgi:exopolysaccharide production protein ExoY